MLLINERDMRWEKSDVAKLQIKNILTSYAVGEGNVTCGVSHWPFGEAGKPHIHETQDEIYIVLRGRGKAFLDGKYQILVPGDMVHARAGEVHAVVEGLSENGVEMFYILSPTGKKEM